MTIAKPKIENPLHDLIRATALSSFCELTTIEDAELGPLEHPDRLVLGFKTAFILIHSDWFDCVFKAHFSIATAKHLLMIVGGLAEDEIEYDDAADFVKEYTNMFGGHFLDHLAKAKIRSELSIPTCSEGFDDILRKKDTYDNHFYDYCRITFGSNGLNISLETIIKNEQVFANLEESARNPTAKRGVVMI